MEDNMFKGRMGRGGTFRAIDEAGITACDSNDPKVRENAHCSNFGGDKKPAHHKPAHTTTRATKAKEGLDAAVVYDYSIGGAGDVPPLGHMKGINPAKPKTKKAAATAEKKTAAPRVCKTRSAAHKAAAAATKPVAAKSTTTKSAAKPVVKKSAPKKISRKNDDVIMILEEDDYII